MAPRRPSSRRAPRRSAISGGSASIAPRSTRSADILLSASAIGRGVGPAALVALVADIRRDPTVPMIGLTTEIENTRAHRAFEKAGFRIARQYDAPRLGPCHLMLLDLRPQEGSRRKIR